MATNSDSAMQWSTTPTGCLRTQVAAMPSSTQSNAPTDVKPRTANRADDSIQSLAQGPGTLRNTMGDQNALIVELRNDNSRLTRNMLVLEDELREKGKDIETLKAGYEEIQKEFGELREMVLKWKTEAGAPQEERRGDNDAQAVGSQKQQAVTAAVRRTFLAMQGVQRTSEPQPPAYDEHGQTVYWIADPDGRNPGRRLLRPDWSTSLKAQPHWHRDFLNTLVERSDSITAELILKTSDEVIIDRYLISTYKTMKERWRDLSKQGQEKVHMRNRREQRKRRKGEARTAMRSEFPALVDPMHDGLFRPNYQSSEHSSGSDVSDGEGGTRGPPLRVYRALHRADWVNKAFDEMDELRTQRLREQNSQKNLSVESRYHIAGGTVDIPLPNDIRGHKIHVTAIDPAWLTNNRDLLVSSKSIDYTGTAFLEKAASTSRGYDGAPQMHGGEASTDTQTLLPLIGNKGENEGRVSGNPGESSAAVGFQNTSIPATEQASSTAVQQAEPEEREKRIGRVGKRSRGADNDCDAVIGDAEEGDVAEGPRRSKRCRGVGVKQN